MPRRVSLPTADDLFRPTDEQARVRAVPDAPEQPEQEPAAEEAEAAPHKPSGRVRHDEKMTVYVTSDELMDLESARLELRRRHGLTADRGRIVREAVALVLEDLEANGAESSLVRRLSES